MSRVRSGHDERLTAGAILASSREARGLSVSDVARLLKLTPPQVEALEAGEYDRLPGRVFARGFLRNYAKLLEIDPQPLLRSVDFDIPRPELVELRTPSEIVIPRDDHARWPLYSALTAVAVVGALAVYEFGFNEPPRRVPASTVVPEEPGDLTGSPPRQADSVPAQPERPAEPAPSRPPSQESLLARNGGQNGDAGASIASASERQLHLSFDQDSWVEIRDGSNKVIFSKLSRAGRQEQVTGTPPFKVTVGNARGVHLKYEDKAVDLAPHTGVTVARVTLK